MTYDWCQCSLAVCWLIFERFLQLGDRQWDPWLAWDEAMPLIFGEIVPGPISRLPMPLVIVGFVFSPCLIFLIRISFERQSFSSTPHFVGLASLYLSLLAGKNLCQWELKWSSRLFSNPVLFSNSKMVCVSWCMCKVCALLLHKC